MKGVGTTSNHTLQQSSVYVRVLPEHCCCGHVDRDGDDADTVKKLCGWTDSSIQLEDRHGIETYDFPSKVLGPNVTQENAYTEMGLPALVEQCTQGYNVLFFAYGQTGTGAERPDKTGEERRSGMDLMMELYLGKEVSTGSQGFLINYELFQIRTAVIQATEQHVKKRPYTPPKQCVTMIQQFIGSCLDGRALLGMVITISQAARNGWETWFTMQYGTDLSKLRAPCRPEPSTSVAKALKTLETAKLRALELLGKTPKSGAPASKYYSKREVIANDLCREYDHLLELTGESCATLLKN